MALTTLDGQATAPPAAPAQPEPEASAPAGCHDPLPRRVLAPLGALFLLVAFVQAPGLIEDDTKLQVVMAPLAWMRSALHLWSPSVASGSVSDETFGYLFPMAPFYELMHLLHVPTWCAERLWLALLLTVGTWGVVRLSEALGIGSRWARVVGGIAYCITPIVVTWASVTAALLAVVLLPWVLVPLVTGARVGSPRRAAARSAVALALMGGVNATVILSALPVGALWLLTRAPSARRRSLTRWWVLCVGLATFWWVVPTLVQGKYGYNYLPYTETASTTTSTASAFEALRGASYWTNFFDIGGPLLPGDWSLVTSWVAIVSTATVTAMGLAGLARRIPERLFLVASLALGVVAIAVGYSGSLAGPFSHQVQTWLAGSLAPFRSVSKFAPDVALPLALGLTWLISEVSVAPLIRRWRSQALHRRLRPLVGVAAVVIILLAAMPFWQQRLYPNGGFTAIPHYWSQAADWLDGHQGHQTALLVPGATFADYTWGKPTDEPLAVLSSTSVTQRNIIPLGSNGNTDMLSAVQQALTSGTAQPGLAEYLSRSGIDYVVERNDLDLAATGAPPPAQVHQVLTESPGLREVAWFGPTVPVTQVAHGNLPAYDSPSSLLLHPVEIYRVTPPSSVVQTFPARDPLVVSGSSGTLLPLAGTGVLAGRATVLAGDPRAGDATSRAGADWVITDGNQRRAVTFGQIDDNLSYLLGPGQRPAGLAATTPLDFAVATGRGSQTVADPIGATSVTATSYGSSPLFDQPSEGPAAAIDGDPKTAWVASAAHGSVGQSLSMTLAQAIDLTSIRIATLDDTPERPTISRVTLTTDAGSVTRRLPVSSDPVALTVAPGRTRHLTITIDATRRPSRVSLLGPLGAGITQVTVPGLIVFEAMGLPTNELSAFSGAGRAAPILDLSAPVTNPNLDFVDPSTLVEPIPRRFVLPQPLSASVSGTAVPSPGAPLEALLSLLATPTDQTVQVSASSWLGGLPRVRPENLVDGASTPWIAGLGDHDPTLTLRWRRPVSVASLVLGLTPQASRPTEIVVSGMAGSRRVAVPDKGGAVRFAPMVTNSLTVSFVGVDGQETAVPTSAIPVSLPVGLSSISIPAVADPVTRPVAPSTVVTLPCGAGPAVTVDGTTLQTAVTGTLGNLIDLQPMRFLACAPPSLPLSAGDHVIAFPAGSPFLVTGLVAQSVHAAAVASRTRSADVVSWAPATRTVRVGAGAATYLQVSQNYNPGWVATLGNRTLAPVRLDGWQQGWVVPAGASGTVTMTFTPDRTYRLGLLLGALFLVLLTFLALMQGHRDSADPTGRRRPPPWGILAVGAVVAAVCIGGWLALALVPLVVVARRWGSNAVAAVAGGSFVAAGIIVAWDPSPVPGSHLGAFGGPAQVAAVVALCAVLSAVVLGESRRRPPGPAAAPEPEA